MPHMRIELRCDRESGRREIVVHLEPDVELLPSEHEQLHRQLVERLLGSSLDDTDHTPLRIVREDAPQTATPSAESPLGNLPRRQSTDLDGIDISTGPA